MISYSQVNTAGFNKPFSEALPIYVSRIEQEVEDRIENYTQVMTNINLLLEKTYVRYIFSSSLKSKLIIELQRSH